jgi:FkbM family methyltransferase
LNPFPLFNRVKQCRHGLMVYNVHDRYVGRSMDLYGEWSEHECAVFGQILSPGMTVVEVGANIGSHTVFLAQAVWPGGQVLAFEPQRIVFQTLCANLALNSVVNVDARHLAVGDAPGTILVPFLDYSQENNYGGVGLGGYEHGEPVPVVTIDSFNLPRCDFLKVDVEGMEKSVLLGAKETLARCQPILYVENDREAKSADLIRAIDALGYRMFWHMPVLFNPNNFAGNQVNVFGNIISPNMLCIPKGIANYKLDGFEPVVVPQ